MNQAGIVIFTVTFVATFLFLQWVTLEASYSLFAALLSAILMYGSYLVLRWIWLATKK